MWNVQGTKDTFYQALRDRIAAGNPARVVVVRGLLRPGILVVENELPLTALEGVTPAETFCLRWSALDMEAAGSSPLLRLRLEIHYATDGSGELAGMDRGRALAAMDAELAFAVSIESRQCGASSVAEIPGGGSVTVTPLGWNIFWGPVSFAPATLVGERAERVAEMEVFGYGQ